MSSSLCRQICISDAPRWNNIYPEKEKQNTRLFFQSNSALSRGICRIHQLTLRNVSLHDGFILLFAHEANVESTKKKTSRWACVCPTSQSMWRKTTLNTNRRFYYWPLGHKFDHTLLLYYTVKKNNCVCKFFRSLCKHDTPSLSCLPKTCWNKNLPSPVVALS